MDRAQQAYQYFIKAGWTPVQAAAIVGNLQQESGKGLNPGAVNPNDAGAGHDSIGIGQWNKERRAALYNFARAQGGSPGDFETQLAFVQNELNGPESSVAARLKNATTVKDATAAFIGYERPQGWSPANPMGGNGWTNRLNNALALAGGSAGPMDDPSIQPQTMGNFAATHLPSLSKLPAAQMFVNSLAQMSGIPQSAMPAATPMEGVNVRNAGGPPPEQGGILSKIFGSMGKQPEPYWMKGKGWDEEAKKAYMAQGLNDPWPSLRSYLG